MAVIIPPSARDALAAQVLAELTAQAESERTREADKSIDPVKWIEDNFYLGSTGQLVKLAPHQKCITRLAFKRDKRGRLPYRAIIYSAVKKSGKSAWAGMILRWFAETQTRFGELFCLHPYNLVSLADNTRKTLKSIVDTKDEGPVWSLEGDKLVPKKIIGWHKTILGSRKWVGLNYQNSRRMSPKARKKVWLTDDHPVLTPDGYVAAGLLKDGDWVVTDEPAPSLEQEQVIAGTLLGDASLGCRPGRVVSRPFISWSHSPAQIEWSSLKAFSLRSLGIKEKRYGPYANTNYKATGPYPVAYSQALACFLDKAKSWYPNGKKVVDRESVRNAFSPRLLATWYMDDGSIAKYKNGAISAAFATSGFVKEDVQWLVDLLAESGYPCILERNVKYWDIYMRTTTTKKFFEDIGAFVPPSMRYKLPDDAPVYNPSLWDVTPATRFIDQVTVTQPRDSLGTATYCIDVEDTHNFISGGLVVHNCIGNDLTQARDRSFREVRESLESDPRYNRSKQAIPNRWNLRNTLTMHCTATGSKVKAISVDAAGEAGGKPTMSVFTELWGFEHPDALRFWDEMTPVPTVPDSFRLVETYAGYDGESDLLYGLYETGLKGKQMTAHDLAEAGATDAPGESYEELLYAFEETKGDPNALVPVWINQSATLFMYWDSGIVARRMPWQKGRDGADYYRSEEAILPPNTYRRLHLNEWVGAESQFVPIESWDACKENLPPLVPGDKTPLVLGIDAATTGDCFAVVAVSRHPNPKRHDEVAVRMVRRWDPKEEGGRISYSEPDAFIRDFCKRHNVFVIVYDLYQLESMTQTWRKDSVSWCEQFSQAGLRTASDRMLYDGIVNRQLAHDGDIYLREHILNANAKLERDQDSKLRLVKKSQNRRIDCAVALSMANYYCKYLRL